MLRRRNSDQCIASTNAVYVFEFGKFLALAPCPPSPGFSINYALPSFNQTWLRFGVYTFAVFSFERGGLLQHAGVRESLKRQCDRMSVCGVYSGASGSRRILVFLLA